MSRVKRVANVAGGVACVACIAWVVWRMAETDVFARLTRGPGAETLWTHIVFGVLLYGCSVLVLAVAWHALLRALGTATIAPSRTIGIYVVSQFGKYFPGGVLQYFGRHALLRREDLSHRLLVLCAVLEAALLVIAALVWAAPLAIHYVPVDAPVVWVVVAIALGFVGWLLRRHAGAIGGGIRIDPPWLALAFGCYLLFFGLMGVTFDLVGRAITLGGTAWSVRFAAVAASWIAGFVVVGAPAGVGVREAVFLALLGGAMGDQATLTAVSAFRIATFGGDLLVFLGGLSTMAAGRRARRGA